MVIFLRKTSPLTPFFFMQATSRTGKGTEGEAHRDSFNPNPRKMSLHFTHHERRLRTRSRSPFPRIGRPSRISSRTSSPSPLVKDASPIRQSGPLSRAPSRLRQKVQFREAATRRPIQSTRQSKRITNQMNQSSIQVQSQVKERAASRRRTYRGVQQSGRVQRQRNASAPSKRKTKRLLNETVPAVSSSQYDDLLSYFSLKDSEASDLEEELDKAFAEMDL